MNVTMMQNEIPSKWESLYGDWCKICRHEKTPICDECSVNERICLIKDYWDRIGSLLSPSDYIKVLFHKCLHCIHISLKISSDELWIKSDNSTEICHYEKKENEV